MIPCFSPSCDHSCVKLAASRKIFYKNHTRWLNGKTIIDLGYHKILWFVSVSQISYCLSLQLWQIIDLLATDKTRYFAQPRPITVNCHVYKICRWCNEQTYKMADKFKSRLFHVPSHVTYMYWLGRGEWELVTFYITSYPSWKETTIK